MRVHREPLLQLGNFRYWIDERPVAFASLVAAVKRIGQIQSSSVQRRMILSMYRLVGVLHRRDVVTHVHY